MTSQHTLLQRVQSAGRDLLANKIPAMLLAIAGTSVVYGVQGLYQAPQQFLAHLAASDSALHSVIAISKSMEAGSEKIGVVTEGLSGRMSQLLDLKIDLRRTEYSRTDLVLIDSVSLTNAAAAALSRGLLESGDRTSYAGSLAKANEALAHELEMWLALRRFAQASLADIPTSREARLELVAMTERNIQFMGAISALNGAMSSEGAAINAQADKILTTVQDVVAVADARWHARWKYLVSLLFGLVWGIFLLRWLYGPDRGPAEKKSQGVAGEPGGLRSFARDSEGGCV